MIIANNQEIQNNCFQEKKSFSENFPPWNQHRNTILNIFIVEDMNHTEDVSHKSRFRVKEAL